MATGTGKTITALGALAELCRSQGRLVIVMACPYKHLVSQWADEFARFGYKYLKVFGLANAQQDKLANQFLNFSAGYIDNLVILTTHDTFATPKFWQIIEQKSVPLLLIADEVHELGATKRQLGLREAYIYRLGLSATPKRWLDDMGTDLLFSYFDKTVFSFSLADAIPKYLTPYDYFPYFVELQDDELEKYYELTGKIVRRANVTQSDEDEIPELYLIERQKIIINAKAKFDPFENIIRDLQNTTHTLVYCSPQQIKHTQNLLNIHNIIQHRFTGQESLKERERLLSSFAKGQHKMLVAMKCLDQGVDVPATRNAIILASSGNPKQFIQRRGRVLRKSPGKEKAAIYDIIVVPTLNNNQLDKATFNMERKILKRELIRYNEFASLALNSTYALNKIGPIKRQYRL